MPNSDYKPTGFANDMNYVELRVSGVTTPKELAGSIAYNLEQGHMVALAAIGHQAVGQGLKAIPIVNGMTVAHGFIITVLPWFDIKKIPPPAGGKDIERTAIMLHLVKCRPI